MYHFIQTSDITNDEIQTLIDRANSFNPRAVYSHAQGLVLATLFIEPSTRTRLSTEAAMIRLGGHVISSSQNNSSMAKGESLDDTLQTISQYSDIIALRTSVSLKSVTDIIDQIETPIINCGTGAVAHPTQALIDLMTIQQNFDDLSKVRVLFLGDNENSRTVASLKELLPRYKAEYYEEDLKTPNKPFNGSLQIAANEHSQYLHKIVKDFDVVYITRDQVERVVPPRRTYSYAEPVKEQKKQYKQRKVPFLKSHLQSMKSNAILMHPLPRLNEMASSVKNDSRIKIWEQVRNGLMLRMSLIEHLVKI